MTRPFLPSNGTDGDAFMGRFCFRCKYDRLKTCWILAKTLLGEEVLEWIEDDDGRNARCSEFCPDDRR